MEEAALLQSGSQSPESGEWEPVEKYMAEMVKKRRMKVERLEQELDALRKHCAKLFESFSVPTFPEGCDPVTERVGDEYLNDGIPSSHAAGCDPVTERVGDEYLNDSIPSSHAAARSLNHRQSPSSRTRNEAEFPDGGDISEEAVPIRTVRNRIPSKTLSSSKSASTSMEARNVMDLTADDEIDLMKDEILRVRPAVKSPRKSPTQFNGISTRIPEKMLKTGPGSNDDSESSDEGSSSESSDEESPSESSDEVSCGNEGSESTSEDSDESDESDESEPDPQIEKRNIKPSGSDPEQMSAQEISSSSASDSLTEKKSSPVKMKRALLGETAKTTWQPKTKAPSSSSEDSDESSSSSDEDTGRNRRHAQTGRASVGRAREPVAPKAVSTSLSPDASPEDLFDWIILGLKGPWLPLALVENSSGASELKDQSLPLKFPSMAAYTATFQKLIAEEANAIIFSEWEQFKAEQDPNTKQSLNVDSRGQLSVWRLRSMVRTMGDPFHYFEAECKQGNFIKFDIGELLCMIAPGTVEVKAVAIVNHQDRLQAPLLRTRVPGNFSLDECVLLRLCNMVTLRRMFSAVTTLSEIFSPLQQQILDPLANIKFIKPAPALEDSVGGDPKLKLSLGSLRNFSDRKILNTLQLLAVSSLLHMRQGFQLVQGPPGTGKTSTIVGMVSTLLIEEPGVRILVCAPSNAALDEMAARLMYGMLDKSGNIYSPIDGSIVRFGAQKVIHPIVQLISLDSLTLRLSSSCNRSRAWVDILDGASVVCATLSGCGSPTFDELGKMFDVVIIDEAAQTVEAEVLIALKRTRGRCVMVGDPQQLPATVFQRPSVAYGRSLFERFQEGGNPVHMLSTQYRMHPSICLYPSKQFYGGELKNSSRTSSMESIFSEEVCERGISVRGCRFKLGHYCFMDVGWGTEQEEPVGHSRANLEEALVVCNVVEGAVKGLRPDRKPNVGVITPYIAQRGVIEGQLERRGIDTTACEVNTVDGFQGREKDVIVLSCVRAMADRGLGFVSDERRMNVALTRAKYSLIIVGHAMTLRKWSPAWDSLIEDARKRGCYQVLKNKKNRDVPSSNWNQSPLPRKDLDGTIEVDNIPLDSRKRSLNSTAGGRPNKKEYSKSMTADTKTKKIVQGMEDSGEATKGKRKREASEIEEGTKNSGGSGDAPNSVAANKLKAREDMLESSIVEKEVNVTANSPNLSGFPKKMKKKQVKERLPESPVSRMKKVKVEFDVAEPSVTKRSPIQLKAVKEEYSTAEKRKIRTVIGLRAPALTSASKRKGKQTARSLEEESDDRPKTLPKSPTKRNEVGAAKLPPEAPSVKEEVIVCEVTSSAPGGGHTWRTSIDSKENGKTQTLDDAPADPIPEGANNWRNAGTHRQSRGWFPNSVSEDDRHSPLFVQALPRNCVPSNIPGHSTQGFANFDQYAVDSLQPQWGNSYEVATVPQNRCRAHELDISTDNMYSVLTRPNNHLGMQSKNRGNLQQGPRNHWQHPAAGQTPPRGHQFGGRQFSNSDHNQPPWTQRQTHSAPPRKKWTRGASARDWKPRGGHPGNFSAKQGHPHEGQGLGGQRAG